MNTLSYHNKHSFYISTENIFESIKKESPSNIIILPHVCNNINVFGGGFTYDLSNAYPIVKANFQVNGPQKLGHAQHIKINSGFIVSNMIAQNGTINKKNTRPLHYPSLIKCMQDVAAYGKKISLEFEKPFQIHAPKFGSGLAGGNWNFIADLIDDIWGNIETYIYHKK